MRLSLCYICPPLAVLFCGKPFSAVLTPPWWAIPLPLVGFYFLGSGIPLLAILFALLWGWPYAQSKQFALFHVMNHLEGRRFSGLTTGTRSLRSMPVAPRSQPRLELVSPPPSMEDPATGHDGHHFRKKGRNRD